MTNALTVDKANNLFQLGKWILSFLGVLIAIVFYVTFYGTSYMKDNSMALFSIGRDVKDLTTNFSDFKTETKSEIKDIKQSQSDMQDDMKEMKWVLDHTPNSPKRAVGYTYKTQHMDANRNPIMVR